MLQQIHLYTILLFLASTVLLPAGNSTPKPKPVPVSVFKVPAGYIVERIAEPPLVRYPLFATLDEQGRLYVAEGTGTNLPGTELAKKKLGRIVVLEDSDGDGKYDTSKVFADHLVFPQGVLWHDGALYSASHPSFFRFVDSQGSGKAEIEELATGFKFNGNGCDIHGPFLGPDGRLYWTDGRHGYKLKSRDGELLEGLAARIWRSRTDGTELERVAGGGFDNPVEIAFTEEGEAIGTMDQGKGDCLLHYVEGAVFPIEHPCIKEFVRTGPLLKPIRQYSASLPPALCGFTRYRSDHLGKEFQNSFFSTYYMLHKVVQHRMIRDGSTFRCEDKDLVISNSHDVHLTDVLEDADGSLVFVDMGAWFTYGYVKTTLPKPEVMGGVYRVRRVGAKPLADPWGKSLKFTERTPAELVKLLDDPRPKVRDQAITWLAKKEGEAIPVLQGAIRPAAGRSMQARRNAVWALCRMRDSKARTGVRLALADKELSVRLAAAHAVGLNRDGEAESILEKLMLDEEMPLRLKSAEALGRIGKAVAVPALLESLRKGADQFLEHALIYALIRINDRKSTLAALDDANPRVRRAGLIALDQMKDGNLARDQVVPVLDTDDSALQQAALEIISNRPGWSGAVQGLLRKWLETAKLAPDQERSLTGALLGFAGEKNIQELVAESLTSGQTPASTRLLLLSVMARCRLDVLPAAWLKAMGRALDDADPNVRREAVAAIKSRYLRQFDEPLLALSRNDKLSTELRIAALESVAERRQDTDAPSFALLTAHLSEKTDPLLRLSAARALGASMLDSEQLVSLAKVIPGTSTMVLRQLLPAYARSKNVAAGKALVTALRSAPAAEALAVDELDKVLKVHAAEVRELARGLREKLAARQQKQSAYILGLRDELDRLPGNAEAGKQAFFSQKVGCYACHKAAGQGGNIGPDLSKIGQFRNRAELLESLVFPSLTVTPEFRTYQVQTKAGRSIDGMIVRETADALFLRTAQLAEIRIPRKDVDELAPSNVSLMPDGLDRTMTRQELRDLLEFLYRLK